MITCNVLSKWWISWDTLLTRWFWLRGTSRQAWTRRVLTSYQKKKKDSRKVIYLLVMWRPPPPPPPPKKHGQMGIKSECSHSKWGRMKLEAESRGVKIKWSTKLRCAKKRRKRINMAYVRLKTPKKRLYICRDSTIK